MKNIYFLITLFAVGFCNAQIVNIPDANFKAQLLAANPLIYIASGSSGNNIKVDVNNDGEIQVSEALLVYELFIPSQNIADLTGISAFANLIELNCTSNYLTSLNLSSSTNLQYLKCGNNQLTSLTLNSPNLVQLHCYTNLLTSLPLNNYPNLTLLDCHANLLTNLSVNNLTNLTILNCHHATTGIPSLPISNLINLTYLQCSGNGLTSLQIGNAVNLSYLDCSYNQISNPLFLNNFSQLSYIDCDGNSIPSLFIKNGRNETTLNFSGCQNLEYICADDGQLATVQTKINDYGYSNCSLNTYCSFTPGGTYYTVQGNSKYDANSNGCDTNDAVIRNFKFNLASGTTNGIHIANGTGNYSIPMQAGTHTLTPQLENPTYFTIFPTSVTANFPSQTSPLVTNFCIASNGVHKDAEITLLPLTAASPGFDANYKLIYKNKGNTILNGSISLNFNDAVLDFVSANPSINGQSTNILRWNYSNLQPFESREILFTLNLNSPTETPPLNNGNQLDYSAVVNPIADDDISFDNTCNLKQILVGSYDPNDKRCIEGSVVGTSMIGQYVHYIIRFENTGTANAQNIVVSDLIETLKFDISTLSPISGSHSFVTRITNTNKVEFIFENINLPFDNANNDGYVAFKIKTKSTLVVGNTFSNAASIYFDYNFPIVTNTATTTIQSLGTSDYEFSDYFTLSPVPTKDVLYFESKQNIEVSSISVYTTLGQLILVETNPSNQIDVSSLKTGNYFIKIISNNGTSTSKFLKE